MFATIAKRFTFDAAHCLPLLPDGHKCKRVHGHTYTVELVCKGRLQRDCMVMDYAEIAEQWMPLGEQLDHHYLNDIPGLEYPTTEILAHWIFHKLTQNDTTFHHLKLVRVYESSTTWCEITRQDYLEGRG